MGNSISRGPDGKHTRLFKIWADMKTRCYNQNCKEYFRYGGRGITICDDWLDGFEPFHDWAMSNGYRDDLTIDRIDVNGNYEPSNCRWATRSLQVRNTRKQKNNTTGIRGVTRETRTGHFVAQICVNGRSVRIGTFRDLEDAADARKHAEEMYWGVA